MEECEVNKEYCKIEPNKPNGSLRLKSSMANWTSVIVISTIFLFGVIYTVGVQSNNIATNEGNIVNNTVKIEQVNKTMGDLKEAIVELRVMAGDVKDIKRYLLNQLITENKDHNRE